MSGIPFIRLALPLALLCVSGSAQAEYLIFGKSKVSFLATGTPGALSFEGKTSSLTLVDDGEKVTFTVPMESVTTDNDVRDQHMNEKYIQVGTWPDAILQVARGDIQLPAADAPAVSGEIPATFTVHGVSQAVVVSYTAEAAKQGNKVKASFPFNVQDHGIDIPSYMGATVDAAMRGEVTFNVTDKL